MKPVDNVGMKYGVQFIQPLSTASAEGCTGDFVLQVIENKADKDYFT